MSGSHKKFFFSSYGAVFSLGEEHRGALNLSICKISFHFIRPFRVGPSSTLITEREREY